MGKAARIEKQMDQDNTGKKGVRWIVLTAALLLAGVATVFALNIPGLSKSEKVKPVNGVVSIPVAKGSDGKAHFYRISDGGKDITFIVVKGSDGQIHTSFDACDACFREKKGYIQDGESMLCKNCGRKFLVDRIGPHSIGGCNPSYLPSTNDGRNMIFKVEDLKQGARYF